MSRGMANAGASGNSSGFRGLRDYGATSSGHSGSIMAGPSALINVDDITFAGFSPTEFMSLSESIAQNTGAVKTSYHTLERAMKIIGGPKDTVATRDKVHQIQSTTNSKIQATSKDLQRLTVVVRHGDKHQRLQVEKLTSEFRDVVEHYSRSQKEIAAKMKGILLINASQSDDLNQQATNTDTDLQFHQAQKQVQQNLEFEKGMLQERESRIRQIEDDVLDVNQIMKELSLLINQQGDGIETIEGSIDHTASNIEAGASELLKAAELQTRYRRKVAILLIIAVIVGLIVTGYVVSHLRS